MDLSPILRRVLQGLLLSAGAPAGWLAIRLASGSTLGVEMKHQPGLYLYMFVSTGIAFSLFGGFGGWRERHLEQVAKSFQDLATTDPLTDLPNRRYFQQRLHEALAAARRGDGPLGFVILDIDHFKKVNDTLGHQVGDRVLVAVAEAMAQQTRAAETAARIGGEELALILPDTDLEAASEAAERIRQAASVEVTRQGALPPGWRLTLSAGVTATPAGGSCTERDLLVAADRALYRAKQAGRDRVETGHPKLGPPPG